MKGLKRRRELLARAIKCIKGGTPCLKKGM